MTLLGGAVAVSALTGLAVGSSAAGIIGASAGVVTALSVLLTALTVFIPMMRRIKETTVAVNQVHTLVNQMHTDELRYRVALIAALNEAGVKVPLDQSLNVAPSKD